MNWFEKADQIGPRDPSRWIRLGAMGWVQFFLGRPEDAIRLSEALGGRESAAINSLLGRTEDAKAALSSCLRPRPDMTIKRLFDDWSVPLRATSSAYQRQHELIRDELRMTDMPEI